MPAFRIGRRADHGNPFDLDEDYLMDRRPQPVDPLPWQALVLGIGAALVMAYLVWLGMDGLREGLCAMFEG